MPEAVRITLVFPNGSEVPLEVPKTTFILDAAMQAGLDLPFTCLQGWCVTCTGRVLDGPAHEVVDNRAALRYFRQDAEAGYVLLCTARPLKDCRIAVRQSEAMKEHRRQHGLPVPLG